MIFTCLSHFRPDATSDQRPSTPVLLDSGGVVYVRLEWIQVVSEPDQTKTTAVNICQGQFLSVQYDHNVGKYGVIFFFNKSEPPVDLHWCRVMNTLKHSFFIKSHHNNSILIYKTSVNRQHIITTRQCMLLDITPSNPNMINVPPHTTGHLSIKSSQYSAVVPLSWAQRHMPAVTAKLYSILC